MLCFVVQSNIPKHIIPSPKNNTCDKKSPSVIDYILKVKAVEKTASAKGLGFLNNFQKILVKIDAEDHPTVQ